jgi:cytochrome c oxidase subunit 4
MKSFFEDPELLVGLPLLALGVFGLLIILGTFLVPSKEAAGAGGAVRARHPDEAEYVRVGLVLAAITAFEVAIYYFDIERALFITILIGLSAVKFATVVLWFMHLKFDSRLFSTAFVTGLALAGAVFTVVIATLGSNLV